MAFAGLISDEEKTSISPSRWAVTVARAPLDADLRLRLMEFLRLHDCQLDLERWHLMVIAAIGDNDRMTALPVCFRSMPE